MSVAVIRADARALPLPDASVDLIVTSPPYYGLRDYRDGDGSLAGQIGSEPTPAAYVAALLDCTREWMRVLKPQGSLFVNLGDKYSTSMYSHSSVRNVPQPDGEWSKTGQRGQPNVQASRQDPVVPPKSLLGLPWRYALGCIDQLGLILRAEIIWAKPNGLPESVTDRVRRSHEQVFHFTRQPRYYSAVDEVREPYADPLDFRAGTGNGSKAGVVVQPGDRRSQRNGGVLGIRQPRSPLGKLPGSYWGTLGTDEVWEIPSQPLTVPAALGVDHFAAFPMELPRRIIAGWSPPGICVACGEGRRPVIVKPSPLGTVPESSAERVSSPRPSLGATSTIMLSGSARMKFEAANPPRLTGYACACPQPDAPTRPAVVADPFGGTGTTALVASVLGRNGFSFDRSADYCRLARWRVTDPGERARAMQVPKPPVQLEGQGDLFGLAEVAP